ncbi:hypothetical protein GCM10011321_22460 [Youhaiella tibetensis]|uniref:Glycosyltransferase family 4 protein n=1 Tax=Paradevosia tibetensis TaxID=1447062 RepID=A0A5B9DMN8_9HYPH|nr:glycosyltransferase family 4 protein [Youhaiella tibetensis]QEE19708.1 glycosyltransferase family 4 protein [Youhaiella tibetensis]GGF30689.1 hypothetical protein GCM10011321_22460 [Youhaiella tibetensis]
MPEICLSTKTWRSGAAWFNQALAQAIAGAGGTIAYIAPLSLPEDREPRHPNLTRIVISRERVGEGGRMTRGLASLRRIVTGTLATLAQRRHTRTFLFSIPEPLLFSLPLFALLRLSGASVVLIVHDAEPHLWRLPAPLRALERAALAASYRLATDLVCLTATTRDALIARFAAPKAKLRVIPHGAFATRAATPIPGSGRLLAFGSIRPNKSLLEVIGAVVRCRQAGRDVTLTIAGEPLDGPYWQRCLALIAEDTSGFDLRPGFVPDDALPELIARSDALVLAYRDFASQSGVAVLAALAARPVIATAAGGIGELMAEGLACQPIPADPDARAIASAISAFYDQPPEAWRDAASSARDHFATALAWGPIGERYLSFARESSDA